MRPRNAALIVLFTATCLMDCTAWRLAPDILSTPVPMRKPLEIWSDGGGVVAAVLLFVALTQFEPGLPAGPQ